MDGIRVALPIGRQIIVDDQCCMWILLVRQVGGHQPSAGVRLELHHDEIPQALLHLTRQHTDGEISWWSLTALYRSHSLSISRLNLLQGPTWSCSQWNIGRQFTNISYTFGPWNHDGASDLEVIMWDAVFIIFLSLSTLFSDAAVATDPPVVTQSQQRFLSLTGEPSAGCRDDSPMSPSCWH